MKTFIVMCARGTLNSFETGSAAKGFAEDNAAQNPGQPVYVYRHLLTVTHPLDSSSQLSDTDDNKQET